MRPKDQKKCIIKIKIKLDQIMGIFFSKCYFVHISTQHCLLLTCLFQIQELNLCVVLNFVMKHDKALTLIPEKQQFPGFTCMHNAQ